MEPTMPAEPTPRRSPSVGAASLAVASRHERITALLDQKAGVMGIARHTLGIICLLITVFLWTLSNFLASVSLTDEMLFWARSCSPRQNLAIDHEVSPPLPASC